MTPPPVLIVIVNYRTADLAIDCLRSLEEEAAAMPGLRVAVVDGASGDGSVEKLRAAIPRHGWHVFASILPLARNGGFSFANNAAIRASLASDDPPELFLLLNPDTIVRPGAVSELVRFLRGHPRAGIAGSRLDNGEGRVEYSAHQLPQLWHEFDIEAGLGVFRRLLRTDRISVPPGEGPRRCGWVSGACMMVRREVFERVGLLDEGYMLYFDEVDLCRRANLAGFEVWYVPAAEVTHLGGKSTGIYEHRQRRARWWYESRRRYLVKAHGIAGLIAADLYWAAGRAVKTVRRLLPNRPRLDLGPRRFARDLLAGDLAAILTGRALGPPARDRSPQTGGENNAG